MRKQEKLVKRSKETKEENKRPRRKDEMNRKPVPSHEGGSTPPNLVYVQELAGHPAHSPVPVQLQLLQEGISFAPQGHRVGGVAVGVEGLGLMWYGTWNKEGGKR